MSNHWFHVPGAVREEAFHLLTGRPEPELGQFTSPLSAQVMAGQQPYQAVGSIVLGPLSGNQYRIVGGQVTLTPGPSPVPTPTPTPVPTPTPTPIPTPPPGTVNVRAFGAKGDGVTDDRPAIQAAINSLKQGGSIYIPAGTYFLGDRLDVVTSGLTFTGDGPTSVLWCPGNAALMLGTGGQPLTGLVVTKLGFRGKPGVYQGAGSNNSCGVFMFGPKGTVIRDCDFWGCGNAIYNGGPQGSTYGTVIDNCRVHGWGTCAVFINGGEQVTNSSFIQDDPDLLGQKSSHGFYVHSGSHDVLIQDCHIANVRKYALQVYGEQVGTLTSRIILFRLLIENCANGIIAAHSQMGAADIQGLTIDSCSVLGTYAGSGIALKNGDGVLVEDCTIHNAGMQGAGIYCGNWAPYEQNMKLSNVQLLNNQISGCSYSLWFLASNGGQLINVVAKGNTVTGNGQNVVGANTPGVTVS